MATEENELLAIASKDIFLEQNKSEPNENFQKDLIVVPLSDSTISDYSLFKNSLEHERKFAHNSSREDISLKEIVCNETSKIYPEIFECKICKRFLRVLKVKSNTSKVENILIC